MKLVIEYQVPLNDENDNYETAYKCLEYSSKEQFLTEFKEAISSIVVPVANQRKSYREWDRAKQSVIGCSPHYNAPLDECEEWRQKNNDYDKYTPAPVITNHSLNQWFIVCGCKWWAPDFYNYDDLNNPYYLPTVYTLQEWFEIFLPPLGLFKELT